MLTRKTHRAIIKSQKGNKKSQSKEREDKKMKKVYEVRKFKSVVRGWTEWKEVSEEVALHKAQVRVLDDSALDEYGEVEWVCPYEVRHYFVEE